MINEHLTKTYCLLLFLVFITTNLYSKTLPDCIREIEIKKPSFYYQNLGDIYYDGKKLGHYDLHDLLVCINNNEVTRLAKKGNNWFGIGYGAALLTAIGFWVGVIATIDDASSTTTRVAWITTGGLFGCGVVSYTFSNYYYSNAIRIYNDLIRTGKVQGGSPPRGQKKVSLGVSYHLNFSR